MPESSQQLPLIERLIALSDMARLRALRLLDQEELSVGELAKALQMPQSTVSRHLKMLHDGGWITKRTAGTASLYRIGEQSLEPAMRELWKVARAQLAQSDSNGIAAAILQQDDARLKEVIAERRIDTKSFFGQIGGEWDALRRELFGETFTAEALLNLIPADWIVADLGCGTGNASEQLAPLVKKVIAIDREPAMLDAARRRLADFRNIEFRQGEIATLPLQDREIDAAVMLLVLIHLPSPADALREVARTLKPGGTLVIVDLVPHTRENYLHTIGHKHLGFDEKQMAAAGKAAGLGEMRYRRLRPSTSAKGPGLFVTSLRRA